MPEKKNKWTHVLFYDNSMLPEDMTMDDVIIQWKTQGVVEYNSGSMNLEKQPPYIISLSHELSEEEIEEDVETS